MLQTAHPGHHAFNAHAEAAVHKGTVPPQIKIPTVGFFRQTLFPDAFQQSLQVVLALDPVEATAEVGPYVLTGSYTNLSYLRARGMRAYGVSPFKVNILDAVTIHSKNERIYLPSLVDGVARTKRVVREYALQP